MTTTMLSSCHLVTLSPCQDLRWEAVIIAVLLSGSGSNLQALLDAQDAGSLAAEVGLVVSDRADAYGMQRALGRNIPAAFVPLPRVAGPPAARVAARADWERRLLGVLNAFTYDLVLLSG